MGSMPDWLQTAWDIFWVLLLAPVVVGMFWWETYQVSFDHAFWSIFDDSWLALLLAHLISIGWLFVLSHFGKRKS